MRYPFAFTALLAPAVMLSACGESANNSSAPAPAPAVKTAEAPISTPEDRGRRQFSECAICHTANEGQANRVGPNLFGVAGREAGKVEGFAYSTALLESGVVWTDESLDAFIENPPTFLRGNRMAYAGQRNAEKRADIIAYLKTLKAGD